MVSLRRFIMNGVTRMMCFGLVFVFAGSIVCVASAQEVLDIELKLEAKAREAEQMKDKREAEAKVRRQEVAKAKARREAAQRGKRWTQIERLDFPEDTTARFIVKRLELSGNTLISTDELLEDMPLVYNASDKPLEEADSALLYDLRRLHEVILEPGEPRRVSTRTVQGFTQYVLSAYQHRNYAGVYVYVPAEAVGEELKLEDGLLPIEVIEAVVSEVTITAYNPDQEEVEECLLGESVIREWSPVKAGEVVNQKELDDFINLLNLNPDRYVSARVSKGAEPKSISVGYDIYEASPWHWYAQVDNAGSKQRRWSPRFGLINTNLTGRDDRFTAVYQFPIDEAEENYSMFGSYEFPVFTPRLRLNVYAGYSEFNIDPEGASGFNFFGNGWFYGGLLRYNVHQQDGWFFDVTTSVSQEKSKITSSLFNSVLGSEVTMNLWGLGVDIHKSDDMSNTSVAFNRIQSVGGSDDSDFDQARPGADSDFNIYTISAGHSRYLDADKIQRVSGSLRWVQPNERLVPARMTVFGGLYSVRGYKENEVVADGGTLLSAQYEYDLVKHYEAVEGINSEVGPMPAEKPFLRRFAPLAFIDMARAKVKHPAAGEKNAEELCSVGIGTAITLGDHFDAGIYYGFPMRSTDDTRSGHGRWNFNLMMRW
jgi:hemolysin activation/secretion protein